MFTEITVLLLKVPLNAAVSIIYHGVMFVIYLFFKEQHVAIFTFTCFFTFLCI